MDTLINGVDNNRADNNRADNNKANNHRVVNKGINNNDASRIDDCEQHNRPVFPKRAVITAGMPYGNKELQTA